MNHEIPLSEISNITRYDCTEDLDTAAAILCEEVNRPFPGQGHVHTGDRAQNGKPHFEFRFYESDSVKFIIIACNRREKFIVEQPDHWLSILLRCFAARRELLTRLALYKTGQPRYDLPAFDETLQGFSSSNTKIAATLLGADVAEPFPSANNFIRRRDNKFVFQFENIPAEIEAAFADPKAFNAAHRDHWLSYVVYAWDARERLLDSMNDPKRQFARVERVPGSIVVRPVRYAHGLASAGEKG